MKSNLLRMVFCVGVLAFAAPLYAQTGCTDSPENPTVVLGVVGSAGAAIYALRTRWKASRARRLR